MRHDSDSQQEAVVNALYEASADTTRWPDALALLAGWTDADAVMLVSNERGTRRMLMQHGHDADYLAEYGREWLQDDPRLAPGAGVDAHRREQRLKKFREWQSSQGFAASFADRVFDEDGASTWLLVSSRDADHQGRVAIRYGRLRGHVERALLLARREAELTRRSEALSQVVDELPLGVLLLEADGRVQHANAAAWRMLTREDALQLRDGRLHALRDGDDAQLQALMRDVDSNLGSGATRWLALPRRGGDAPYTVAVHAGAPKQRGDGQSRSRYRRVFIGDATLMPVIGAGALSVLFDLTAREAQVCVRLLRGLCLEQAAADLGISPRTARVYLQQVYGKVGVHRQADLVRLLMSCPTSAAPDSASTEVAAASADSSPGVTRLPLLGIPPRHTCSPGAA